MSSEKIKFKDQPYYKYWGDWKFVNPYWIFILALIAYGARVGFYHLVGDSGVRISNDINLVRTIIGNGNNITVAGIIAAIVNLVLIVGIIYISVWVLPNKDKYNRLRLAGVFIMEGAAFKAVYFLVNMDMTLHFEIGESFKVPMITCADIYILGGIIAIIVILIKTYSNQELEDMAQAWKAKHQKSN
ncbi:MAG: hypothetical protein E7241_07780 [Lachnospiraceae bacterium]|jgi:hypothetical protein|nr:hypothetical protein [Lachnospiraceae bacterium]